MDVQATVEAPPLPPIAFNVGPSAAPPPQPPPTNTNVAPVSTGGPSSNGTGSSTNGATNASTPNIQIPSLPPHVDHDSTTLGAAVASAFNTAADNVQVSFQVDPSSKDVVIVFTDKTTGKPIVQFPSETLIALAQFFNKLAGVVLDKKA